VKIARKEEYDPCEIRRMAGASSTRQAVAAVNVLAA